MTRNRPSERTLRIIGGNWRSRKVSFPPTPGIRPSPDRVRETLFNWLQFDIAGARCLELYAGSGILSMEALSRGASHVTAVDVDAAACAGMRENMETLGAGPDRYQIVQTAAAAFLESSTASWDIVFVDPPFDGAELERILSVVATRLTATGALYIESPERVEPHLLPEGLQIHRQKRAGRVHFALCVHPGNCPDETDPE